jgi:signal transduction histidine kinase
VLVCVAVAGVAVLVAGLVMAGLARRSAQGVLQDSLAAQADVLASQVDERGLGSRAAGLGRAAEVVRGQGIAVVILLPRRGIQPGDQRSIEAATAAGLTGINGGQRISTKVSVAGQEYLVEARGVGPRSGFALVEPLRIPDSAQRILIRNILLALGAGLLVAALAGGLLGRLLARPLRRTADVAGAMRQGRRDLHVPVEGPAEVAEVAEAVNELSIALGHSEERQREFLLADGVVTGPEAQHAGQVIQRESQRLERLVSDLLDLARLGADQFGLDAVEVDLRETITACAEVWRVRCERQGVQFRLELPPAPAVATTDARRIRQVLDGLAENALRVTPAGSQLTLALESRPGTVLLQVRDGGPGLAPEDYAVAFERGVLHEKYRGRRPVGSGIGLALAFGLVSRLGGTMTAGPAPEGGATFTVWLPAT